MKLYYLTATCVDLSGQHKNPEILHSYASANTEEDAVTQFAAYLLNTLLISGSTFESIKLENNVLTLTKTGTLLEDKSITVQVTFTVDKVI